MSGVKRDAKPPLSVGLRCRYDGGGVQGNCNATYVTDLSNSTVGAGVRHASKALNGTYNADVFTAEAVRLIRTHGGAKDNEGLYVYLAYQNVHSAAQSKDTLSGSHPLHAPCHTVDGLYSTTTPDTYKVMGSM